jgi:biotin carboxyl carrier protein
MEAMKMENNVMAEKGGTVKAVKVAVGESVLQDDVLVEIA